MEAGATDLLVLGVVIMEVGLEGISPDIALPYVPSAHHLLGTADLPVSAPVMPGVPAVKSAALTHVCSIALVSDLSDSLNI